MDDVMHQMISLSLGAKLGFAVLGILVIHAVFRVLEQTLPTHFRELDARYRVRKFVVFAGYIVGIVFIALLFADRLGRVARIPNSAALKGPVFNCSQGFRFVWDEIKVPLTGDSNHLLAREMLLRIADEAVAGYLEEAETSWREVTYNFRIADMSLAPTATLIVNGGSLEFTLSYIVDYTNRTAMQDRLFSKIVEEIKNSKGELAWASPGGGRASQVVHSA